MTGAFLDGFLGTAKTHTHSEPLRASGIGLRVLGLWRAFCLSRMRRRRRTICRWFVGPRQEIRIARCCLGLHWVSQIGLCACLAIVLSRPAQIRRALPKVNIGSCPKGAPEICFPCALESTSREATRIHRPQSASPPDRQRYFMCVCLREKSAPHTPPYHAVVSP